MDPDVVDLWTLDAGHADPLRDVLAGYLGLPPDEVPLTRTPAGKPALTIPGPTFSLSHTGGLVVVAVTARPAVGVDVERAGRRTSERVMRRALTDEELHSVAALPPTERAEAFLRHWTVKEAYLKAVGTGLSAGLRTVSVDGALTAPRIAADGEWSVQRFDPRPGYLGAVVAAGPPWTPRTRAAPGSL
jgi:4'-phosphopantetheinyl transferase